MKRLAMMVGVLAALVTVAPASAACAADETCLNDPMVATVTGKAFLPGDPGRTGGSVFADYNGDGTRQERETAVPVEMDGSFSLPVDTRRLAPGSDTVAVRWTSWSGGGDFAPECVGGCVREVRVAARTTTGGVEFPVLVSSTMLGQLWDDRNENGRRDAGEPPLNGLRVFLDDNGNGRRDGAELWSTRAVTEGRYSLPIPTRYKRAATLPPIVVEQPVGFNCTAPADCARTGVKAPGGLPVEVDHGLARPVVIFTHGYGGSRIVCPGKTLWFDWFTGPDLMNLRLGKDRQNLKENVDGGTACSQNASVDGLVMEVAGEDIYGGSSEHFEQLAPGRHHDYVWDWRRDPSTAVKDLDALVDRARREHGVARVVLVGHSQGGLVMRHYVDDPDRAAKVSRAVTIGTPYWGSPKTILPLAAGIELPWYSPMDVLMGDIPGLKAASRTLPGHFSLVPAFGYGDWLTVNGKRLDMAGVKGYLEQIGVDPSIYTEGAEQHGRVLDHFEDNGVDFHVIVGGGVPTIGRIGIEYGLMDELHVDWTSGDETVPQRAAEHDAPEDRLHRVCGLTHVPITSAPETTALMDEFLIRGEPMGKGAQSCNWTGQEVTVFYAEDLTQIAGAAQAKAQPRVIVGGRSMTVADAERAGHVQVVRFGQTAKIVSTGDVRVELPKGATSVVRALSDRGAGAPRHYVGGKAVAKDVKAPVTKASWRGGKLVLRARDASKVAATFVIVGGKKRVYKKPLRLTAKQRRTATFGSVDVWGNAEKVRRVRSR